ncbi:hypothetical protein KORDIASMS9_03394 [Kordia sp. SMS9]|nr:hypothetical protein KORDIASMS9_03394 [Kordia sp. SMS9]
MALDFNCKLWRKCGLRIDNILSCYLSMSFIMTYYTFKSKSVWPAVIFHAVSNVYIQKILPKFTINSERTEHWLGENGIMCAVVTCVFGIFFWYKGVKKSYK